MPRKRNKSDQTHAQRVTAENDQFRAEAYADAVDNTTPRTLNNDDLDKFRKDTYKQALKDAKATRA